MPRQKRLSLSGCIYHIIARGIERRTIFQDNEDRKEFLGRLSQSLEKSRSQCHAWALMPNHFHLLIRSSENPLSDLMRRLMSGYAGYFNRRHHRSGHLFQNRYKSILCQEEVYFLELVRYIHLNPVRAGLVKRLDELDRYPWTGHATLLGKAKHPCQEVEEVLSRFHSQRGTAAARYREFIADGWQMGKRQDLVGGGLKRSAGGWEGVQALKKAGQAWQGDARILGQGDFVTSVLKATEEQLKRSQELRQEGWTIEKILERGCEVSGIKAEDLQQRGRLNSVSKAKGLIAYWAVKELGINGSEVSKYLGISRQAVSLCVQRGRVLLQRDPINLTT